MFLRFSCPHNWCKQPILIAFLRRYFTFIEKCETFQKEKPISWICRNFTHKRGNCLCDSFSLVL